MTISWYQNTHTHCWICILAAEWSRVQSAHAFRRCYSLWSDNHFTCLRGEIRINLIHLTRQPERISSSPTVVGPVTFIFPMGDRQVSRQAGRQAVWKWNDIAERPIFDVMCPFISFLIPLYRYKRTLVFRLSVQPSRPSSLTKSLVRWSMTELIFSLQGDTIFFAHVTLTISSSFICSNALLTSSRSGYRLGHSNANHLMVVHSDTYPLGIENGEWGDNKINRRW